MNEETKHPAIEPELEARIVALVLGEASDFEREELNRLIELRSELAAFKFRMQRVHGLLQDVGAGEFESPAEDWKLPADRRNAVLAVIRGEATVQAVTQVVNPLAQQRVTSKWSLRWTLVKVAAGVCVAGFVGVMVFPSYFLDEKAASEYFPESAKLETPQIGEWWGGTNLSFVIDAESPVAETASPQKGSALYSRTNRKSVLALSAIQETLNNNGTLPSDAYLADDVQYKPRGLEFELPEEAIAQSDAKVWERQDRATATMETATSAPQAVDSPELIASNSDDSKQNTWLDSIASIDSPQDEFDRSILGFARPSESKGDIGQPFSGVKDSGAESPGTPAFGSRQLTFPGQGRSSAAAVSSLDSEAGIEGSLVWDESSSSLFQRPVDVPDAGAVVLDGIRRQLGESAPGGESATPLPALNGEREDFSFSGTTQGIATENRTLGFADVAAPHEESALGIDSDFSLHDIPSQGSVVELGQTQEQSRDGKEESRDFAKNYWAAPADGSRVDGEKFGNGRKLMEDADFTGTTELAGEPTDMHLDGLYGRSGGGPGSAATGYGGFGLGRGGQDELGVNQPLGESSKEIPTDPKGIADRQEEHLANFDDSGPEKLAESKIPAGGDQDNTRAAVELPVVDGFISSLSSAITNPADESAPLSDLEQLGKAADAESDEEGFKKESNAKSGSGGVAVNSGEGRSGRLMFGALTPAPGTGARSVNPAENGQPPVSYFDGNVLNGENLQSKPEDELLVDLQRKSGKLDVANGGFEGRFRYAAPGLYGFSESMKQSAVEKIAAPAGLNEKTAADEAFSTFSLHVSDVSFKLALAALGRGEWPEAAKVRIEEFVNAFDYGDPMPAKGEKVACYLEQSIHPFVQQRNLLRVSMMTAAAGRSSNTPLRLTFLLDNSGSMERTDRQQTVRRAFALLAQQLTPIDQVTLISFARQPRLLADKVSGADAGRLVTLIDELPSEGGTNIEAALQLAFEKAREQQTPNAQNRIILLTDGAVNLGNADPESLSQMVTTMRSTGIAFDAAGISAEGLNDEVLEALTRKGDGRYYLLDSIEDADDGFARQIAGALRPSAKNVKVQVEFNPKRVGRYKLLGFEKHILKTEDFRNDTVDAAEMAAAEAGVAMYQFEARPDGEGDVGSVSVRFLDLSTGQMIENRWPIPFDADAPRPDQAAPSLRVAASAALLAAKLRGEPLGEAVDLQALSQLMSGLPQQDRNDSRVQQLQQMIEQARQLSGK